VQSLETMAHSGPLSSASTLLNEDDLEVSPAGSSEVVPQRAEIEMHFRPPRSSSSRSRCYSRSASPGSRCGSSGPLPRKCPVFERREDSSRSPPRSGSGTLQQQAESSKPRERAGPPGMALEGKSTIKLALLQAQLLGQAELRSQSCAQKVNHERQQVSRQQQHVVPAAPCPPLEPPQSLHTLQSPRMFASQPHQSTRMPPTGAKQSQQSQQPLQRQMSAVGRHNRHNPGQSPRARSSVPTSPILGARRCAGNLWSSGN